MYMHTHMEHFVVMRDDAGDLPRTFHTRQLCQFKVMFTCRPRKMIVKEYMSQPAVPDHLTGFGGELQLATPGQDEALQKFTQYLAGFRGVGQPHSRPKVAIVQTQTYQIHLQPSDSENNQEIKYRIVG